MKKIIRDVNEEKGIVQVTIADERWYLKNTINLTTGIPEYTSVPSVTWITQSYPKGIAYFKWFAEHGWDEAEAIKNAAGDKGTKVHAAIEAIFRGEEVRIDSQFMNKSTGQMEELSLEECDAILSFLKWRDEMKPEPIAIESTVFSEKHNYAGTIDLICKIGEDYWIIDFKTSQQVWPSHELQLSAYRRTIENGENSFDGIKDVSSLKTAILQVGYRKNRAGFKFTETIDKFNLFLAAQTIWKNEHEGENIIKKDYPIILSKGTKPGTVEMPIEDVEVKDLENIDLVYQIQDKPKKAKKEHENV